MFAIKFTVYGHPEPKGSARAFLPKDSKHPVVTTANKKAKPWQQQVAGTAFNTVASDMPFPRPRGVCLTVKFVLTKPKSLAKKFVDPTKKPDLDKLIRLVSDALTGIVWQDDSQVVSLIANKEYGEPERAEIEVDDDV